MLLLFTGSKIAYLRIRLWYTDEPPKYDNRNNMRNSSQNN